jgi:hypothetical protein
MTRSAYGPAWTLEANRRRLELTRGVTVMSMAAQTDRDWTWLVAIDRVDPLRIERMQVFRSGGVPVEFLEIETGTADRSAAAVAAYRAPWDQVLGGRHEQLAMTRLDDDDALAPWVMGRIRAAIPKARERTVLVMPRGIRVWRGRLTVVRHDSNAMQTLVTPPGDRLHVYDYGHRTARRVARVRNIDQRLAWLWARHPDTISGWHISESAIPWTIRAMFPIDWSLLDGPWARATAVSSGRYFR